MLYNYVYVCLQVDNNACLAWQATNSGDYITPELSGQIILFAFILNVIAYAFKSIKRSF